MKKLLSILLSVSLVGALAAPAAAAPAESTDARLAAITETVKTKLGLDTTAYADFDGTLSENELAPVWYLSWSGEGGNMDVSVTEAGEITSYSCHSYERSNENGSTFAPTFPATTRAAAQETAAAMLEKVLAAGETLAFDAARGTEAPSTQQHHFSGSILIGGLPSPLTFSAMVDANKNEVTRMSREVLTGAYTGGVPSATPAATIEAGKKLLDETQTLRAEYVLNEDGKTATLRYLPNRTDDFFVDAQTGKLVNLTELRRNLNEGSAKNSYSASGAPTAAPEMARDGLTEAEQTGAEKLEGVLSKDALAAKAVAISELGLSSYTLVNAYFAADTAEEGQPVTVTAHLRFTRQEGEKIFSRTVTMDAKTGALISVYSSAPRVTDDTKTKALTEAQAKTKAETFLAKYDAGQFAKSALYTVPSNVAVPAPLKKVAHEGDWDFTYAQQEQGYFFPANFTDISVDELGNISAYRSTLTEGVTFSSAEGIVSDAAAQSAYAATFTSPLQFVAVPQKLATSSHEWERLISLGYSYFFTLKLGYALDGGDKTCIGIDAKTGEAVFEMTPQSVGITYSDVDGIWVQDAALALAQYGVGFGGGKLDARANLTQRDLLLLLAASDGFAATDPATMDAKETDRLYAYAYGAGLVTKAERSDAKLMTRAEVVRTILNGAGYGKIAALEGIFKCSFADEASIAPADYGYLALAEGLGLVQGDGGNFYPTRTANRAEAVSMLYRFMSR